MASEIANNAREKVRLTIRASNAFLYQKFGSKKNIKHAYFCIGVQG